MGTIAALATFGAGYVARPVGSFFLGHLGDKYGRKKVLILTLVLMGVSTFLVGCLPTYSQVGILAPILLVACRLLQGISAAGEQAGANSMSLEHAPAHRRAFFTSWTLSGTQGGLILATLVFIPLGTMPEAQLLSWGWRIPFFLSVVVVMRGLVDPPHPGRDPGVQAAQKPPKKVKLPVAVLFRENPGDVVQGHLRLPLLGGQHDVRGVFPVLWGEQHAHREDDHADRGGPGQCYRARRDPGCGSCLADRVGPKPVFIFGDPRMRAPIWPYLWAIQNVKIPPIFRVGLFLSGVVYSATNGIWPAMYNEQFDTRDRLSGTAIGTQIGFMLGGFAPAIASAILEPGPNGWVGVAGLHAGAAALISAISASTARETYKVDMNDLGKRPAARGAA